MPQDYAIAEIDLTALSNNYHYFNNKAPNSEISCVIKADAYGLGMIEIAKHLHQQGCQTFFVAQAQEGAELRKLSKDIIIYVLNGLTPRSSPFFIQNGLRPCLSSLIEVEEWSKYCKVNNHNYPAAIHVDTGFNRLGIPTQDFPILLDTDFTPCLLMSHLACADTTEHKMNQLQLDKFLHISKQFPSIPKSLANTAGVSLGEEYHFDMIRIGIGLYKGSKTAHLSPVLTLLAPILQIKHLQKGETIGYGATFVAQQETHIAIIALGYADGYPRRMGSKISPLATAWQYDHYLSIIGRISMDMIAIDITKPYNKDPESIKCGDKVEFIGKHVLLDDIATYNETIPYEILTNLGRRIKYIYKR